MQNIRVFTVYHFFWFDTRILVKLSRYTSWLVFCEWIVVLRWSQQYRSDGNQNDTAGKSCLSYKASLPYSQPDFFTLYFVYIASNFKELLGTRSHLIIFFVSAFNERRQTNWKVLINFRLRQYIYTSIDTILCLVLIRWKIFQGIYINWHP